MHVQRETAGAVLRVKAKDKAGLAMRHNQCESWGRERCNSLHWENPAVAVLWANAFLSPHNAEFGIIMEK